MHMFNLFRIHRFHFAGLAHGALWRDTVFQRSQFLNCYALFGYEYYLYSRALTIKFAVCTKKT